MLKRIPPHSGDICDRCPNPDIVSSLKVHFGKPAWEWECHHAEELHVLGEGMEIVCAILEANCCVDNNKDYFVVSPKIYPLRSFLEATKKYLGLKS